MSIILLSLNSNVRHCTLFRGLISGSKWRRINDSIFDFLLIEGSHARAMSSDHCVSNKKHTTDRESRSETHVARYRSRNTVDENGRRNSSLITTCARCGRRHRRRMSVKVYLGDRSYDDCRPTCSCQNDNRFLMKQTAHSNNEDSKASQRGYPNSCYA